MVAVRLARAWIGYGGAVHRAGDLVDVDAVTLAKLEASGVVTPGEESGERPKGPTDGEEQSTGAWGGPTGEGDKSDDDTSQWGGPTDDGPPDPT